MLENLYPVEFDNFPVLTDFSDEIGGEINECDYLLLYNENVPTSRRSA